MTKIEFHKSTSKKLALIGMCIPLVLIGIWMITTETYGTTNYILSWIVICLFGLGIPIGIYQLFYNEPQIIITEIGVWDKTTKQDEIKWEQIVTAYPLDIFDQKYISIIADNTYVFKKKQSKFAAKINEKIGAQQLNLNLALIDVEVNKLSDLINNLAKSEKDERQSIIQSFRVKKTGLSILDFKKILVYISISIILLLLSLTNITALWTIMIIMGIAALTARWFWGSNEVSSIRKYAGIVTWLGFVNVVLFLITIESYDYFATNVGRKISTEIEDYKKQYSNYPRDLKSLNKKLDLNLLENYFADQIEYQFTESNYELKIVTILNNHRKYDKELQEWK